MSGPLILGPDQGSFSIPIVQNNEEKYKWDDLESNCTVTVLCMSDIVTVLCMSDIVL